MGGGGGGESWETILLCIIPACNWTVRVIFARCYIDYWVHFVITKFYCYVFIREDV